MKTKMIFAQRYNTPGEGALRERWERFWKETIRGDDSPTTMRARRPQGVREGEVVEILRDQDLWPRGSIVEDLQKKLGLPSDEGARFFVKHLREQGKLLLVQDENDPPSQFERFYRVSQ